MGSNDESMQVPTLEVSAICDVNVKPVEGNISPNYGFKWYSASIFDHCNGLEMACPPWNIYIYMHTRVYYILDLEYLSMR